jgi:hypothetical protein
MVPLPPVRTAPAIFMSLSLFICVTNNQSAQRRGSIAGANRLHYGSSEAGLISEFLNRSVRKIEAQRSGDWIGRRRSEEWEEKALTLAAEGGAGRRGEDA